MSEEEDEGKVEVDSAAASSAVAVAAATEEPFEHAAAFVAPSRTLPPTDRDADMARRPLIRFGLCASVAGGVRKRRWKEEGRGNQMNERGCF